MMGHNPAKYYLVPFLITFVFVLLTAINPPIIDEFVESLLVDYRFKIRNVFSPPETPDNILIVTIDEKSLTAYGRWPWNRLLQAALVRKILEGSPRVLGVDIFYSEPESAEGDRVLAELFRKHRHRLVNALGCEVEKGRSFSGEVEGLLYDAAVSSIRNLKLLHPIQSCRVLLPPAPIANSGTFGHVYSLPDRDGKLRWEPLYIQYGQEFLPSFSLQIARIALGIPAEKTAILGGEGVQVGKRLIPTDAFGRLHINYLGREGTFHHVSASDLLSDTISSDLFKNKIVLLGTSALATYDLINTPFSANMTGVEKNATAVSNIIARNFIRKAPLLADLSVVLALGTLVAFLLRKGRALISILLLGVLLVVLLIANQISFSHFGLRWNLFYPFMTVLSGGTYIIGHRYFLEEKRAKRIRRMFSSYVTERVVNELILNPELARLGGERREVTVLFSDIRDFTSFSEQHAPEDVVAVLNEYLAAMTDVVFTWEGTLDKFIGDAIMAFWNAPVPQEGHAELAVRCALNMIQKLKELQQKWIQEGKTPLDIGIGINSGEVLVGNIGAEGKKMDYTLIGDHVNLGARIESLTRKYNSSILMTESTLEKIRDLIHSGNIGHVSIKGLEQVIVKGKKKSVEIYEVNATTHGNESLITGCEDKVVRLREK